MCEQIFHQLAAQKLNVSALQRSIAGTIRYSMRQKKYYSIHYLTGENRGLSVLNNIWPVIRTGDLLSVILRPAVMHSLNFYQDELDPAEHTKARWWQGKKS